MKWTLPGTVLTADREEAKYIENQFVAMFMGGGIALSQLEDDFQLRGCEGLYFIGETTDCAGFCGGYNLHWAFGSAILAGKSAATLRKSAPKKPAKAAPKKKKR